MPKEESKDFRSRGVHLWSNPNSMADRIIAEGDESLRELALNHFIIRSEKEIESLGFNPEANPEKSNGEFLFFVKGNFFLKFRVLGKRTGDSSLMLEEVIKREE